MKSAKVMIIALACGFILACAGLYITQSINPNNNNNVVGGIEK